MAGEMNDIAGLRLPPFLYGTAWKEDQTRQLVELAIACGFRGIDTANQRKHYHEAAVGEAIAVAIAAGRVTRDELFLQTKFTFLGGQDHRLPYDPAAPIGKQVEQSLASSLAHLGVEQIDSYVLHGPSQRGGWAEDDRQAWQAMEAAHAEGRVRLLGVSNVSLAHLQALASEARVQPRFVQNRCYAVRGWDREVRAWCRASGCVYQGFSLLTANQRELSSPAVAKIAQRHGRTIPQVVFRFAQQIGMLPLTGTTDEQHMRQDLAAGEFELEPQELAAIEKLG